MNNLNNRPSTFEAANEYDTASIMPLDPQVSLRYPGIDPAGKYSIIDMDFAYRMARIQAVLQIRDVQVRRYAEGFLASENSNPAFSLIKQAMLRCAAEYRQIEEQIAQAQKRSEVLALREQARMLKEADPVVRYSLFLSGLEYLAGIKQGPLPADVDDLFTDLLHKPIDKDLLTRTGELDRSITEYGLEFQNFDNILRCQGGDSPTGPSLENAAAATTPYARATSALLLDALFQTSKNNGRLHNRLDLITVDGMTVREKLYSDYLREREEGFDYLFSDYLREKDANKLTHEIVSAALMSGARVELFVPDQNGNIPETPVQLLKTGYTAPVERVTLNAWERFFSRWGFFKEKTIKALDYERTMEARQRVQIYNTCSNIRADSPTGVVVQRSFLGEPSGGEKSANERTSLTTLAACAMLAEGYSLADLIDPTKLVDLKRRYGEVARQCTESGKNAWRADVVAAGTKKLTEQFCELARSINITDPHAFRSQNARPLFFAAALAAQIKEEEVPKCGAFLGAIGALPDKPYTDDPIGWVNARCGGISAFMQPFENSLIRQGRLSLHEPDQTQKALSAVASEKFHILSLKKAHAANPEAPLWMLPNADAVSTFSESLDSNGAFKSYASGVDSDPDRIDEVVRDMANGTLLGQMHFKANAQTGQLRIFEGVDRAENAEYMDELLARERGLDAIAPQKPKPPARTL